jgi:hypothetical protein
VTDAPSLHSGAIAAYRASSRLDQRPVAVLAAVHQELYAALASANSAYAGRDLEALCQSSNRAAALIVGIETALSLSGTAGEAQLLGFYRRLRKALISIQHDAGASVVLHDSLVLLRGMCVEFHERLKAA